MDFASIYGIAVTTVYFLNFLIALTIIFGKRKSPASSLAWLLILFGLPGLGLIGYSIFSQDFSRRKNFNNLRKYQPYNSDSLKAQIEENRRGKMDFGSDTAEKWKSLILLNQTYSYAYFTRDNSLKLITEGEEFIRTVLEEIDQAKKFINAEYYIIKPDHTGTEFLEHLTAAARRGVEVRLLMDGMGCMGIKKKMLEDFIAAGGKYAIFFEPKLFKVDLNLNYRNHRKILVVDGNSAITGGSNIADEYRGISEKFGGWRDTNLLLKGDCVRDLDARFTLDWRITSGDDYRTSPDFHFPPRKNAGSLGVQILSSGPERTEDEIRLTYMNMITSAKKSIYIQSPYFIPDDAILESLKAAALSGVDVRIMIPDRPDHVFVYWATYHNVGSLLSSGVKIYTYSKGFMHAKTITVDDEICCIGSANFDMRSFSVNFETNALIYDRHLAISQSNAFKEDIKNSARLTQTAYNKRPVPVRMKEAFSRLISSIL